MKVKAIECHACKGIVWSRHRHDCRSCECGAVTIDGGREYTRVLWDEARVPMPETFELETSTLPLNPVA